MMTEFKRRKRGTPKQIGQSFPVRNSSKYISRKVEVQYVVRNEQLQLKLEIQKRLPEIIVNNVSRTDIAFGKDAQVKLYYDVRTGKSIKAIVEVPKDMDSETKRFAVSHEIGHLVARELTEEEKEQYFKLSERSPSFLEEDFANDFAIVASRTTLGRYSKVSTKVANWIRKSFLR